MADQEPIQEPTQVEDVPNLFPEFTDRVGTRSRATPDPLTAARISDATTKIEARGLTSLDFRIREMRGEKLVDGEEASWITHSKRLQSSFFNEASIVGTGVFETAHRLPEYMYLQGVDPDFDPYANASDLIAEFPLIEDDIKDGVLEDLTNQELYNSWLERKRVDAKHREILNDLNIAERVAYGIPGVATDIVTGGIIVRGAGIAFAKVKGVVALNSVKSVVAAKAATSYTAALGKARNFSAALTVTSASKIAEVTKAIRASTTFATISKSQAALRAGKVTAAVTHKFIRPIGAVTKTVTAPVVWAAGRSASTVGRNMIGGANVLATPAQIGVKYAEWMKRGNLYVRMGKLSASGGVFNAMEEVALGVIDSDRTVDDMDEIVNALYGGIVFGGAIGGIIEGHRAFKTKRTGMLIEDQATVNRRKEEAHRAGNDVLDTQRQYRDDYAKADIKATVDLDAINKGTLKPVKGTLVAILKTTENANEWNRAFRKGRKNGYEVVDDVAIKDAYKDDKMMEIISPRLMDGMQAKGNNKVLDAWVALQSTFAVSSRLQRSKISLAKLGAYHLLDYSAPLQKNALSPLTEQGFIPAASYKQAMEGKSNQITRKIDKVYKEFKASGKLDNFKYEAADGDTLLMSGSQAVRKFQLGRAALDYRRRLNDPDFKSSGVHPSVIAANQELDDFFKYYENQMKESGVPIAEADSTWSTRYKDVEQMKMFPGEHKQLLFEDYIHAREQLPLKERELFDDLKVIPKDIRSDLTTKLKAGQKIEIDKLKDGHKANKEAIREDVKTSKLSKAKKKEDLKTRLDAANDSHRLDLQATRTAQKREFINEDMLLEFHPSTHKIWDQAIPGYFRGKASNVHDIQIDDLVGSKGATGSGMGNVFKKRSVPSRDWRYSKFYNHSLQDTMDTYTRRVAGRIALRRSILGMDDNTVGYIEALTGKNIKETMSYDTLKDAIKEQAKIQAGPSRRVAARAEKSGDLKLKEQTQKEAQKLEEDASKSLDLIDEMIGHIDPSELDFTGGRAGLGLGNLAVNTIATGTIMSKLGGVAKSAIMDFAHARISRIFKKDELETVKRLFSELDSIPKRDLEFYSFHMKNADRGRHIAEDYNPVRGGYKNSFYYKADKFLQNERDRFFSISQIKKLDNAMKLSMLPQIEKDILDISIKFKRAGGKVTKEGVSQKEALRLVGADEAQSAQMSGYGINARTANQYINEIMEHGQDINGKQPWTTFDEFEAYSKDHAVYHNYQKWGNKKLVETITTAVDRQVGDLVPEPKIGSLPANSRDLQWRMFNMFQSFTYSFANQTLNRLRFAKKGDRMAYMIKLFGFAVISKTIHDLTSRGMSLENQAKEWEDNTSKQIYETIQRSPILGWFSRPMGLLESTPIGISKNLDNHAEDKNYYRSRGLDTEIGGAGWNYASDLYDVTHGLLTNGKLSSYQQDRLWKLVPYNNLWQFELATRPFDLDGKTEKQQERRDRIEQRK